MAIWLLAAVLAGCSVVAPPADGDADVLVVGDSILAWHRGTGRSIPDVVAAQTGLEVSNVAISGARFLGTQGIPSQYVAGDWDVVIFNGGGNDISPVCGSGQERVVLDRLISADGQSGALPQFARRVVADGARAVVMRYYPVSVRGGPFAPCAATLSELGHRQARMAQALANVTFVDAGDAVRPDDLSAYGVDLVHPTPAGSATIGQLIARRLN